MNDAIIRLDGQRSSYVIDTSGPGVPLCRYWGARLPEVLDLTTLPGLLQGRILHSSVDQEIPFTLFPELGLGWFGAAGLLGNRDRRDWATAFTLETAERTTEGLKLRCRDAVAGLELVLEIALDQDTDVLTRRTLLRNLGSSDYGLEWCAAGAFALPSYCTEALVFEGQHTQEFQELRVALRTGTWSRENRRGRTSHDSYPQLVAGNAGFSEDAGAVYGFHLDWSGNHRLLVDCQNDATRQVQLGEWLAPGELVLAPGEVYESPTVYASFADQGLNQLSDSFHRYARRRVFRWPGDDMSPRPVHLNTWEALYFKHQMADLKALARAGAVLGVERFVLDDGWFVGRNDDHAALGDWVHDPKKYPQGLGPLVDYVRGLGMEFGLWVEPEMVNPDSDLYRAHPDWALHLEGRPNLTARNQLVLDLSRPEVSDYLYEALHALLSEHPIGYLKWDHNRDLTHAGSRGLPAYRNQSLALYELLRRLRAAHPEVEIESCASGGGRIDYGILGLTQRVWTSDSNDALERQLIQRGYLRFFPPEIMGAHVGPSPAHTSGRRHSLAFRAATALFGHFGLELDVRHLDQAERSELAAWIALHKRFRGLLHSGRSWRLDRLEPGTLGHGVVSADRTEALYAIVQMDTSKRRQPPPVQLPGLDPQATYRLALVGPQPPMVRPATPAAEALAAGTLTAPGALLAAAGLRTPTLPPETALLIHLEKV